MRVESGQLSYLPLPYYYGIKGSKSVKAFMKDYLKKVNDLGSVRVALRQDPCVSYDDEIIKAVLADGFMPYLFYTSIFDLKTEQKLLWKAIRARYHGMINGMKNDASKEIIVVTGGNVNYYLEDWASLYKKLVARSGKVLHEEVFHKVADSILNGHTILYLLYEKEILLAGLQIDVNCNLAYHTGCGIDPDYEHGEPYMHYITWYSIVDLKQRGLSKVELGPVFFQNMNNFYSPSEKELSISHFKLGMGGDLTPFIIFTKETKK